MRVSIEFDLDTSGMNEDYVHDLMADWTYEMRVSSRIKTGSWRIVYDVPVADAESGRR